MTMLVRATTPSHPQWGENSFLARWHANLVGDLVQSTSIVLCHLVSFNRLEHTFIPYGLFFQRDIPPWQHLSSACIRSFPAFNSYSLFLWLALQIYINMTTYFDRQSDKEDEEEVTFTFASPSPIQMDGNEEVKGAPTSTLL